MKTKFILPLLLFSIVSSAQFLYFEADDAKATTMLATSNKWYNFRAPADGFDLFKSNVFQLQTNEVNIYSELVSDKIGIFRLSLGTHINSGKDTTLEDQTIETLMNGGGNGVLSAVTTFAYNKNSFSTFCIAINPKIGFQLPALGSLSENTTFNAQLGAQVYYDVFGESKKLKLFGIVSASQIVGSDDLYTNLNVEKKMFFLSQLNFGVVINDQWRIMASYPLASTYGSLVRQPVSIGTQIIIK